MKRNYKLLLFIILVGIIFAPNVYAAGYNGKARYVSGDIYYGIKYSPDGTDQQTMKIHHQQMEIGGSRYPAYCVDPGLSASNGENYICYPTTDEGLKNLWSKISGLDYPTATMAARMYAILTGTGMEAIDKDGKVVKHDSINGPKIGMVIHLY
jgi:hypothetical protein